MSESFIQMIHTNKQIHSVTSHLLVTNPQNGLCHYFLTVLFRIAQIHKIIGNIVSKMLVSSLSQFI